MSCYHFLGYILGLFLPSKEDAEKLRHFGKEIDMRKKCSLIHSRYAQTIKRLREKYKNNEKIKVVFLNETPAKWQYQSLYDELNRSDDFEVQVLVTVMNYKLKPGVKNVIDYKTDIQNCCKFFKDNGMNVDYAFDLEQGKPYDLETFKPDIIFYEQPWGLFKIQNIEETSKYALTCYSSYGAALTKGKNEYGAVFFKLLYKYFIDNEYAQYVLVNHSVKEESTVVAGHPKLDAYGKILNINEVVWKENKKRIIIAPHFSFYKNAGIQSGTFDKNYQFYLDFAKKHQEYEFVFKPHPRLKEDIVIHKLMTKEECENYYNEWDRLPNAHLIENGNYIDIFRTSDLLITDCNSFLFEYLPAKNPVIIPRSKNFIGFNMFGKKITAGYYVAKDNNEIEKLIKQLLVDNNDYLKDYRLNLLNTNIHPKEGYAVFVKNHLKKILSENNEPVISASPV